MNARWQKSVLLRRLVFFAAVISALGAMLAPITADAHPQTRGGFFLGFDAARGSAGVSTAGSNSERSSGWGGGFRLGYAPNPKYALGIESNRWVEVDQVSAVTLGTLTAAVSVFPAEGLVLRAGYGIGDVAGAGGGLSGEVGSGWMVGAGYEFRVARSFAIGPQLHYNGVNLKDADFNFFNTAFAMTWYFIPE
jgi:hypothetical protein